MARRRPSGATTVAITLSAKAGVPSPTRPTTTKIEAFIALLYGRSPITCSNQISSRFAGVVWVARCVLALSLPCIAACQASGSIGAVQSRANFELKAHKFPIAGMHSLITRRSVAVLAVRVPNLITVRRGTMPSSADLPNAHGVYFPCFANCLSIVDALRSGNW